MNLKRHHVLYALLALVLVPSLFFLIVPRSIKMSDSTLRSASSATVSIQYEIVTSEVQQEKGLSGRSTIPPNYGMLFVFPKPGSYGFWMKDMLAPIDILWLSDKGAIIKIDADVATSTYPTPFYPPKPVPFVLEMKAGEAARLGLSEGAVLNLPLPYGK